MYDYIAKANSRIYWQYKNSPKLINWLRALPEIAQASIEEQFDIIKNIIDIDTAEGEALNIIGRIVNQSRWLTERTTDVFFSLDTHRLGFDNGFWHSSQSESRLLREFSDDIYRLLIKVKIIRNVWSGNNEQLQKALSELLSGFGILFLVIDNMDMTISILILPDPDAMMNDTDRLIFDSAVNKGEIVNLPDNYLPSTYYINPIDNLNAELYWAIKSGYLTVKASGVGVEMLTTSTGHQLFGFDFENDYIAGFEAGAWGENF